MITAIILLPHTQEIRQCHNSQIIRNIFHNYATRTDCDIIANFYTSYYASALSNEDVVPHYRNTGIAAIARLIDRYILL